MTSKELRNKFLDFFKSKGHEILPASSLTPSELDPTALFISAGMQPLVPFLLGEKHSAGNQLTNIQPCIRTDDIDEVGDNTHLTFFEMLGYWSLGAYWKKEAIEFTFEFLTRELNIDLESLAFTCFEGDAKAGIMQDTESAQIWENLGVAKERIAFLGYKDNFWGPVGGSGPCGPDTEIFVWTGAGCAPKEFDPSDKNWVEIGNDVFMAYQKSDGKYLPLEQRNVDFGSGFERLLMTLNGVDEIYKTDLFELSIKKIEELSNLKYGDKNDEAYIAEDKQCWVDVRKQFRIIADHIRSAVFAINDGIIPSNKDRGYIVRRLIRRAVVKAHDLKIKENFSKEIAECVFETYNGVYDFKRDIILSELEKEENRFRVTLAGGLKLLQSKHKLTGQDLFDLYQSFGLPLEVSLEEAKNHNIEIEPGAITSYEDLFKVHQELSRTASAGMFKGGLVGETEQTTKYHTATHLLLAALRQVLGDGVHQKGANITDERIRFDFSYPEKMTPEQIKQVEDIVNSKIAADLAVDMKEMSQDEAQKCGAMGDFAAKYGDKVKVYNIGDFSKEICGGPHVEHTGLLGHFKITKEESSSSGVRRIKAILE
jgi:alanyl-tRNA synthetase